MKRGKFIVFEGIDGSGKSTHADLLRRKLEADGEKVYLTAEPSEGEAGLFMTDRIDHIKNPVFGILSHLEKGETVLCDRYYFSSFAYNSIYAPMEWVLEINAVARRLLRPDLTVFLDIDPESFSLRTESRGTTERYEKVDLLRRVRDNYMKAFSLLPDERVEIVDNRGSIEEAAARIYAAVRAVLDE